MEKSKQYIGVAVRHAEPMTRKEYNDYRGWELPKDENGDDKGFLVENRDVRGNVEGKVGYVSWLPEDVFNSQYKEADTPLQRMNIEEADLADKYTALYSFNRREDKIGIVGINQAMLMEAQEKAMETYLTILRSRMIMMQG